RRAVVEEAPADITHTPASANDATTPASAPLPAAAPNTATSGADHPAPADGTEPPAADHPASAGDAKATEESTDTRTSTGDTLIIPQ
ncbi:MAG TPA: hypothetical protein VGL10_02135, partial [Gammaproteobacteria bacterium]